MPFLRRVSACACVYRQTTSPRLSLWKSHGETITMSLSLIQTRLFILPRMRHNRSAPSWHLTRMRSKPRSFTTTPKTSPCAGYFSSPITPSLSTFFFPKLSPRDFRFNGMVRFLKSMFIPFRWIGKDCAVKLKRFRDKLSLTCRLAG